MRNNSINSSTNTNSNGRKRHISMQKSSYNKQILLFMKNKDSSNISLYTHIQNLLDMFIFQNPMHPIKYFEYYSENLKKHYNKSYPDQDLDFLNNIEQNIYKKIMDIYKDNQIKSKENPLFDDKVSNLSDEDIGYEGENEYEDDLKNNGELNETIVQDLSKTNYIFNKAGCGLTNDEVSLIGIAMNQMSRSRKFKSIRYWGKIFGLKQNYYILECEWRNEELQFRFRTLNKTLNQKNKNNYEQENIYENGEEVEAESLFGEFDEQIEPEEFNIASSVFDKNTNEQLIHESDLSCPFLRPEPSTDNLPGEVFGFGANKMSYFVTNKLSEEWIELPLLKPHHVIQSRNIKRYFVGNLESHVESYPFFQGLEKHYLRAHIARITACTHVSPSNYFVCYNNNIKSNKWKKLNPVQLKAMSQKWVHEYVINNNYDPLPVYDLLKPNNWMHHTPLISSNGVTNAWSKLFEIKESNSEETMGDEQIAAQNLKKGSTVFDQYDEYPDIFVPLSNDIHIGKIPPWKFELTNPFDHKATYVTVKSNLWPGAFAVTRNKFLDYTYHGWGHKWDNNSYYPREICEYQSEYPNDTMEITEIRDPTYTDEIKFHEDYKKMKEEKKARRFALNLQQISTEDEEIILNQYSYDV